MRKNYSEDERIKKNGKIEIETKNFKLKVSVIRTTKIFHKNQLTRNQRDNSISGILNRIA